MLQLKSVSKQVLVQISVQVQPGDFVVIIGPNGAGKSTLLRLMSGELLPQEGTVELDGRLLASLSSRERAQSIARLLQDPSEGCIGSMTVAQNLALAASKGDRARLAPPRPVLMAELEPILDRPMNQLSGGQRQMVCFHMATVRKPRILLLDEPTAALDTQAADSLLDATEKFCAEGGAALLITHDRELIKQRGNWIWRLEAGKISTQMK